MPLSQWVLDWHKDIREGFEQCARTAGRIELRCPPPKLGPGPGLWQQLREVSMMMQSPPDDLKAQFQCAFVGPMRHATLILLDTRPTCRFNTTSTLEIPSQS